MKMYEISISYFIDSTNECAENESENLVDSWENTNNCVCADWYDDGEDYCVNIVAQLEVSCHADFENIDKEFSEFLNENGLDDYTWDYHYIKGIDNNFNWEP